MKAKKNGPASQRHFFLFAVGQAAVIVAACSNNSGNSAAPGGSSGASSSASTAGASSTAGSSGSASTASDSGPPYSVDAGMHWVGTWSASPYPVPSGNLPPAPLSNSVLRQVVHVSLGGSQIRLQFSNLSGNGPVTINSAHVAICRATPTVDSTIDPTTDTALAFSGAAGVTIPQGQEIWSDPVDFTVPALGNVSITTAFGSVPSALTGHAGSRTTSYQVVDSTDVSAPSMVNDGGVDAGPQTVDGGADAGAQTADGGADAGAQTVVSWYYISGMEVMTDGSARAIVAIGDSLTDGRGSDTDMNDRWTDDLETRVQMNAATSNVAMLNMGIGGTDLVGPGTAAQARFPRDVLGQAGVRYVIVWDGVNDIGAGAPFTTLMPVYASLISQAHAAGLLIYGTTITPFGSNAYYTPATEAVRQQVNTYIRSGVFDACLDFDAQVTAGGTPPVLQAKYDTWAQTDGLHLNPAGYEKVASSVDLTLFTR